MPRFCANLTMMFTEVDFLDRFAAAARAGFPAVEMLSPYDAPADEVRAAADEAGVEIALFNTPAGDFAAGERGFAAIPGKQATYREGLEKALTYAEVLEPDCIHVMAGRTEGEEARNTFVENLKWTSEQSDNQRFSIEPINHHDIPGYFLGTTAQAMPILDEVGAPNVGLQFDLYHVQIMEGDLTRRLRALADRIFHTQIAGVPERHEPDAGEFNLDRMMQVLDEIGYSGWVGAEYNPRAGTVEGLGWYAPWRPV